MKVTEKKVSPENAARYRQVFTGTAEVGAIEEVISSVAYNTTPQHNDRVTAAHYNALIDLVVRLEAVEAELAALRGALAAK